MTRKQGNAHQSRDSMKSISSYIYTPLLMSCYFILTLDNTGTCIYLCYGRIGTTITAFHCTCTQVYEKSCHGEARQASDPWTVLFWGFSSHAHLVSGTPPNFMYTRWTIHVHYILWIMPYTCVCKTHRPRVRHSCAGVGREERGEGASRVSM